jgi:hypothetical protein
VIASHPLLSLPRVDLGTAQGRRAPADPGATNAGVFGPVAQPVERRPVKPQGAGSIPARSSTVGFRPLLQAAALSRGATFLAQSTSHGRASAVTATPEPGRQAHANVERSEPWEPRRMWTGSRGSADGGRPRAIAADVTPGETGSFFLGGGVEQLVARRAHNPEVASSNLAPASSPRTAHVAAATEERQHRAQSVIWPPADGENNQQAAMQLASVERCRELGGANVTAAPAIPHTRGRTACSDSPSSPSPRATARCRVARSRSILLAVGARG